MMAPFKEWVCTYCGYVYDEAQGDPARGTPPGTRFADLPEDWTCPDCESTRADFVEMD